MKDYKIFNDTELVQDPKTGKMITQPKAVIIDNSPEYNAALDKVRRVHAKELQKSRTKSAAKLKKESDKVASGASKAVPKAMLAQLEPMLTNKSDDTEWKDKQIALLLNVEEVMDRLEQEQGIASARKYWTKYVDGGDDQGFLGAILACNVGDEKLIDAIMALRKLDLFSIEALAAFKDDYRLIENLFLHVGYNYWSTAPAKIVGAAVRIQEEFGQIPTNPKDLLTFYGIGRKIMMIVMVRLHTGVSPFSLINLAHTLALSTA